MYSSARPFSPLALLFSSVNFFELSSCAARIAEKSTSAVAKAELSRVSAREEAMLKTFLNHFDASSANFGLFASPSGGKIKSSGMP